jgi:hypothetical protein
MKSIFALVALTALVSQLSPHSASGAVPAQEAPMLVLQSLTLTAIPLSFEGQASDGPFDPDLNQCIGAFYKNDPITGDHLILKNNCYEAAHVFFYASPQIHGATHLEPGESDNTYQSHDKIVAAGGVSIYACPEGDIPRKADGTQASDGVNNQFRCSRK